jgi:putative redox protein
MDLVLAGLAGCTGMDVISILEKKREDITGLTVRVTGSQREDHPTRWQSIHVEYEFSGRGVKTSSLERAIELSEEKYCAVRWSLTPEIDLTSSYSLVEENRSEE